MLEWGFKVLKSEVENAPVYHRLAERIRAHAMLCFMALIVYRVIVTCPHLPYQSFGESLG